MSNLEEVVLLQVNWQLNATNVRNGTSFAALQLGQTLWLSSEIGAELAKALVICSLSALALLFAYCLIRGLPQKALQDPKVKEGCPGSWVVYMGLVYAFLFFSTDQYLASLPQMGLDLGGSQWIMSASIQSVFAIKGVVGIGTAALSDRIGRRPVSEMTSWSNTLIHFDTLIQRLRKGKSLEKTMGYQMGDLANNTLQTWLTAIPKRDVYGFTSSVWSFQKKFDFL